MDDKISHNTHTENNCEAGERRLTKESARAPRLHKKTKRSGDIICEHILWEGERRGGSRGKRNGDTYVEGKNHTQRNVNGKSTPKVNRPKLMINREGQYKKDEHSGQLVSK